MQLNFDGDSNLYEYESRDKRFEFPTNIKQMGCIDENIRIYMEDYVYTYLFQYAKSSANKEKLAILVGRHMTIDGEKVIIISGAIQGKATAQDRGVEVFTEETWDYINHQMEVYFKGMAVLGWMHTQPGYGAFLMSRDEGFHRENFKEEWQVLYVLDPVEKLDGFFIHNSEKTALRPAKGYFIYYDKNENMQEYMIENSVMKPKLTREEEIVYHRENGDEQTAVKLEKKQNERIDAAAKIRKVLNQKMESDAATKNRYSLLAGISGVLCIACLLMGAGLIHNQDKIRQLETEVVSVKTSYDTILARIDNSNVQTVFADTKTQEEEPPQPPEPQPEVQKPETQAQQPPQPPVQPQKEFEYYVVEEGDNLGYISKKFYGTTAMMDEIMQANGLEDADKIYFGQKLAIPKE